MQKEISRNLCSPDLQIQITKMMTASLTCKNIDGQIDPSHVLYMLPPEILELSRSQNMFHCVPYQKKSSLLFSLCHSRKVFAACMVAFISEVENAPADALKKPDRFKGTTAPGMTANNQTNKQETTKRKAKRNNSKNTNNNKNNKNRDKEQKQQHNFKLKT